jgi:hypothetical protein
MHEFMKKARIASPLVVSAAYASCLPNAADFPGRTSELARATASLLFWQFSDELLSCELAQWTKTRSGLLEPACCAIQRPTYLKRTELILAGRSKSQMFADMSTAFDKKELPALEPGAMCYMLSRQGYLSNRDGRWRPHLMFFVPPTELAS